MKNVIIGQGKSKKDKYFQYNCTICDELYIDTVSNIIKSIEGNRFICKKNKCN